MHDARKVKPLKDLMIIRFPKGCPMHKGLCGSKQFKFLGACASGMPFGAYDPNYWEYEYECGNGHRFTLNLNLKLCGELR